MKTHKSHKKIILGNGTEIHYDPRINDGVPQEYVDDCEFQDRIGYPSKYTPRELWEIDKKAKARELAEARKKWKADKEKKAEKEQEMRDYLAACDVPLNNTETETSAMEVNKDALLLTVVIGGGLVIACCLGFMLL